MKKRRIFTIAFWVFTVLLLCTAVSFKIQDLMRNEVVVRMPELSEDGMTERIPASAVIESEHGTGIFLLKSETGIGGAETRAKFNARIPIGYEGEEAVFTTDVDLNQVITEAVYPVEEGMVVEQVWEILPQKEAIEKAKEQKENLKHLLMAVLFAFLLAFVAERCMKRIFDKKYGIFCVGMILIFTAAILVYVSMNRLEIPRPALPQECIFDWEFYKQTYF